MARKPAKKPARKPAKKKPAKKPARKPAKKPGIDGGAGPPYPRLPRPRHPPLGVKPAR